MSQLRKVAQPFGEVNVYPAPGGRTRVVATILMEPRREGTQTGIALDGSGSMSALYGGQSGGAFMAGLFGKKPATANQITPVARAVCAYLARKLDADGGTTSIYWATGPGGGSVEVIGDLTAEQAERQDFGGPRAFGSGTQLLPAVRYFVERFASAPWGFYAFITDGELHDLEEVKAYSTRLARDISAGRRRPVKFVLIGLGAAVNEKQMEELDDLDTGTAVDLWDHKIAEEMRHLEDIFAEVVDRNARVADRGRVVDPTGRTLKDYSDTGVPAVLEFEVPAGTAYFTLEADGHRVHQPLSDTAVIPAEDRPAAPRTRAAAAEPLPVAEEIPEAQEVDESAINPLGSDGKPAPGEGIDLGVDEARPAGPIDLKFGEGETRKYMDPK